MAHGMVLGPTGCGKTTLARHMAKKSQAFGVPVLVLDPSGGRWIDADFVTQNTNEFIAYAFANERCFLIIDEAGEAIGRAMSFETQNRVTLATRTRHRGHNALFIAQRASLVTPSVRSQCQELWCFRQGIGDVKMLCQEFCNSGIMAAASLKRGFCLHADSYGHVSEFNVFDLDKTVRKPSNGALQRGSPVNSQEENLT